MNKLLLLLFTLLSYVTYGQDSVENEWLVQLADNAKSKRLDQNSGILESELISESTNVYRIKFKDFVDDQEEQLRKNRSIVNYQRNLLVELRNTPNDEFIDQMWSLENIDAIRAWDITTGGKTPNDIDIVVAIIDEGFDINHEDLENNIWINEDEIPNNNLDDDNNGYVDDVFGANLQNNSGDHRIVRHGTAVTGIIGGKGNNGIGVAGVNWDIKMMILSNATNVGLIVEAYEYIYQQRKKYNDSNGSEGAYVVASNVSLGISNEFGSDFPIWCNMYDQLGSVGVLNIGSTDNANRDVGELGDLPSTCSSEHLIIVTNSTELDQLDSGAAYSNIWVDLAAPGSVIALDLENNYRNFEGTSASCPYVCGTAALLYSSVCDNLYSQSLIDPPSTSLFIKDIILDNVEPYPAFQGITTSGGRLNIYSALNNMDGAICGESAADELEFRILQDDLNSNIYFEITPDNLSPHILRIFDTAGRLIMEKDLGVISYGQNVFLFDIKHLTHGNIAPYGAYIALLENEESKSSQKFIYLQ